jgi:hypothetical protein
MADEIESGLTDRVEHVAAAEVQCDGIDLQPIGHDGPLSLAGVAPWNTSPLQGPAPFTF